MATTKKDLERLQTTNSINLTNFYKKSGLRRNSFKLYNNCERRIDQHDTSVGQRYKEKLLSPQFVLSFSDDFVTVFLTAVAVVVVVVVVVC